MPMSRVPESPCPNCGHVMNGATDPEDEDAVPVPGDATVCIDCAALLVFGPELQLGLMSPAHLLRLSHDERLQLSAIQHFIRGELCDRCRVKELEPMLRGDRRIVGGASCWLCERCYLEVTGQGRGAPS